MADDKRLELKLTQYGLDQIDRAMHDPSLNLALTKIRIGSGDNNEYYEPSENELADPNFNLKGDLGYEFYIYDKQLLEDGLTISFHTIIPENASGFDIREVGLYETDDNGDDHLFAICTQQPIVKPSTDYNYFINVNYYIFLKAHNLANVYERITLDVEHAQVSEADMEELMRNFLFAQENLMVQIGKNSELLGYNRPSQITEKINSNKQEFSYISLYKNFASLLDLVTSPDNIISYWVFEYSRRESLSSSIVNLANMNFDTYLATNASLSSYPHQYKGFQSTFTFEGNNCYYLPGNVELNLYDPETEKDKSFTMVFALSPIQNKFYETRTLIAKSNRAQGSVVFEVQELNTGALQVRLYESSSVYLTFITSPNIIPNAPHSIVLTYNADLQTMNAFINSRSYPLTKIPHGEDYHHMNPSPSGSLYKFISRPEYKSYVGQDYKKGEGSSTFDTFDKAAFCDSNGVFDDPANWELVNPSLESYKAQYKYLEATKSITFNTVEYYCWGHWAQQGASTNTYPDDGIIYLRQDDVDSNGYPTSVNARFYNADFIEIDKDDSNFKIVEDGSSYTIKYEDAGTEVGVTARYNKGDIQRKIYEWTYTSEEEIYAPVTVFHSTDYPLYKAIGDNSYALYTGHDWQIQEVITLGDNDTEIITYELFYVSDGTFSSITDGQAIQTDSPNLTSYIINENGIIADNVNSSVGLISIINEELSTTDARVLALNLCATLGRNPFLDGD